MRFIAWVFCFIYELIVSIVISVVGHHRNKGSFKRGEKVYQPIRNFIEQYFKIKIKPKTYQQQLSKTNHSLSYKVFTLTLAILAILWIRYSIIEPYKIPSGSLIPTLKIGDHIFVNKLAYGLRIPFIGEVKRWSDPKRGEVVIFVPPLSNGKVYVKRLVGVPGDKIRVEDDKLYINDQLITKKDEPFYPAMKEVDDEEQYDPEKYSLFIEDLEGTKHYVLQLKDRDSPYNRQFSTEVVVPEGSYFFMGDNRDNSEDSRVWGFATRNAIRGKAMFVWLSLNWSKSFTPSWIRFSRFGKWVK